MSEYYIIDTIKRHEGFRSKPYDDATGKLVEAPEGKLTIGYGFNIQENGIPQVVAQFWINFEYETWVLPALERILPKFDKYSVNRKAALASMMFNLGEPKFRGFKKMIAYVRAENWIMASKEAEDSNWFKQTKTRAIEICDMLITG